MKVRFLLPVARDRSGNTLPKYPEDFYDRNEVVDLADDLARQFIGEGCAVVEAGGATPAAAPEE